MTVTIGRRELLAALGGAAAAWPLGARAQQAEPVRRIGVLMGGADDAEGQARVTALKQGLQELGWTESHNIQIETRFAGADAGPMRADAAASRPGPAAGDKLHSDRYGGGQRCCVYQNNAGHDRRANHTYV
jgi:hypothetical protein